MCTGKTQPQCGWLQAVLLSNELGTRNRKNGPGWLWLHLFLCWSERWPIQRAKTSIRNKSLFRSQSFASVNFPTTAPHPSLILTINSRIRSEDHNQAGLLLGEEVVLTIYWEFHSSRAAVLLPRQTRGTFRKLFTKHLLQVTALSCRLGWKRVGMKRISSSSSIWESTKG